MGALYGALAVGFGVLALWMWRYVSRESRRTRDWPTVPGTILERGVGAPLGRRTFMPLVRYAYAVDGADYANDQVYLIRRTGRLRPAVQRLVDRLPDPVPVHYDPADPASSYLIAGPRSMSWTLLVFGILAVALGMLEMLVALT